MAVTRTLAQLAGDLRLGDGTNDPSGPAAIVLARIDATARAMVLAYAPNAPDAIHNEAYVRLAGWFFDQDPSGSSPGGPSALRASGAAALLGPYRVRRAGRIGTEAAAASPSTPSTPSEPSSGTVPMPATPAEAAGGTSTTIRSWTSKLIRAAINAVVPQPARAHAGRVLSVSFTGTAVWDLARDVFLRGLGTLTGHGGKVIGINADEDDIEFVDPSGADTTARAAAAAASGAAAAAAGAAEHNAEELDALGLGVAYTSFTAWPIVDEATSEGKDGYGIAVFTGNPNAAAIRGGDFGVKRQIPHNVIRYLGLRVPRGVDQKSLNVRVTRDDNDALVETVGIWKLVTSDSSFNYYILTDAARTVRTITATASVYDLVLQGGKRAYVTASPLANPDLYTVGIADSRLRAAADSPTVNGVNADIYQSFVTGHVRHGTLYFYLRVPTAKRNVAHEQASSLIVYNRNTGAVIKAQPIRAGDARPWQTSNTVLTRYWQFSGFDYFEMAVTGLTPTDGTLPIAAYFGRYAPLERIDKQLEWLGADNSIEAQRLAASVRALLLPALHPTRNNGEVLTVSNGVYVLASPSGLSGSAADPSIRVRKQGNRSVASSGATYEVFSNLTGISGTYRVRAEINADTSSKTDFRAAIYYRIAEGSWTLLGSVAAWGGEDRRTSPGAVAAVGVGAIPNPSSHTVDIGIRLLYGGGGNLQFDYYLEMMPVTVIT